MNTLERYLSKGGAQGIIQRDAERREKERAAFEQIQSNARKQAEAAKAADEQCRQTTMDAMALNGTFSPAVNRFRTKKLLSQSAQTDEQRADAADIADEISRVHFKSRFAPQRANSETWKNALIQAAKLQGTKFPYQSADERWKALFEPKYREPGIDEQNAAIPYLMRKFGLGVADSMQGVEKLPVILSDAVSEGSKAVSELLKNPPNGQTKPGFVVGKNGVIQSTEEALRQQAAQKYIDSHKKQGNPMQFDLDKALDEERYTLSRIEDKGAPAPKWLGDTSQAIGGMTPSVALNAAAPGLGLWQMGASVLGNTYTQNRQEGNDYINSLFNAGFNAGSEVMLEKAIGILGEGATASLTKLSPTLQKALSSSAIQKLTNSYPYKLAENAVGEGIEESIQEPVSLMIDSATGKKITTEDMKNLPKNMLYSGTIGGLTGAGLGGLTSIDSMGENGVISTIREGNAFKKSDMARSMASLAAAPTDEGGAPEGHAARLRAENILQKMSDGKNPSGYAVGQLYNAMGRPTDSQLDSATKYMQRQQFVKSIDNTGSEQNLQRFAGNVDKVFKGELPELSTITIGHTPLILQKYGASNRPMTISQSTMYKIAYPQGYFGAKEQGHNLGIPALKQLPAQIANPAAILKSNTRKHDGSLVLLTEWNDTHDDPVIIPIHLDRQGNVSLENRVASAYGKRNLDTLLTDENGDSTILYTKENKSIDELRGYRLQLPVTPEDDTLVSMNSIPQKQSDVKGGFASGETVAWWIDDANSGYGTIEGVQTTDGMEIYSVRDMESGERLTIPARFISAASAQARSGGTVHIDERTDEDFKNKQIKAFQYEYPQIKPYYKQIAQVLLGDLRSSVKGQRIHIENAGNAAEGIHDAYTGTKRHTSKSLAYILDNYSGDYTRVESALRRIIEDNGKENTALPKEIEGVIDDMLTNGYTTFEGYSVSPNEGYIALKRSLGQAEQNEAADGGVRYDRSGSAAAKRSGETGGIHVDTVQTRGLVKDLNNARKVFIEHARNNFPKSVINESTGKQIDISRIGLDKFLSGNISAEKLASGYVIPELIETAEKVGEAADNKGRDNISGYEYYYNTLSIDGNPYAAHIRVRNTQMGDKYYGHTISNEAESIEIEPLARSDSDNSPSNPVYAASSNNNIAQKQSDVKNDLTQTMQQERMLSENDGAAGQQNSNNVSYLTDNDIDEYMATGNQHTTNKKAGLERMGERVILTSKNETDAFIEKSLSDKQLYQIKAFAKVTDKMAVDIKETGGLDVNNYYLELNSSDLRHTSEHMNETKNNQIPLTLEDIKRLPEYMVNYDDVLEVNRKKDGRVTVLLGKKINGHSIIATIASDGRKSLTLKTAYMLDTQKYNALYGINKEDIGNRREAHTTNNVVLPDTSETVPPTISSDNRIPQLQKNVKSDVGSTKAYYKSALNDEQQAAFDRFNRNGQYRAPTAKASTPEQQRAKEIAGMFGHEVIFFDDRSSGVNGAIDGRTVFISQTTADPVMKTLGHELTHSVLTDDAMKADFINLLKRETTARADFQQRFAKKQRLYQEKLGNLDDDNYIWEEFAADVGGDLFMDDNFIERVTRDNQSLAKRIVQWFKDVLARLTGKRFTADGENLRYVNDINKVIRKYEQAFSRAANGENESVRAKNNGVKYDIRRDSTGRKYWLVETEKDIFKDIKSTSELKKAAYNYILGGADGIQVNGSIDSQTIIFNRVGAKEYVYGRQSQKLSGHDYQKKMRLSPSIDDLIENADVSWTSPDAKNHKQFNGYFDNYRGRVGIDNAKFEYVVRVGYGKSGEKLFYDVNLEPIQKEDVGSKGLRQKSIPHIKEAPTSSSANSISDFDGEVKYSIKENSKGKYVQAERQVIQGDNADAWEKQIYDYINEHIRNGRDIVIPTDDGDRLTITEKTAWKMGYRNEVDSGNGKQQISDNLYKTKMNAAAHIDEIAEISKRGQKTVPDTKNHGFAKDGFNYRTAYFRDLDGQYYKLTISVGLNSQQKTVYNIGKIKRVPFPDINAQRQRSNNAPSAKRNSSTNNITENKPIVKHSLKDKKVSQFRTNTLERSASLSTEDLQGLDPSAFEYIRVFEPCKCHGHKER